MLKCTSSVKSHRLWRHGKQTCSGEHIHRNERLVRTWKAPGSGWNGTAAIAAELAADSADLAFAIRDHLTCHVFQFREYETGIYADAHGNYVFDAAFIGTGALIQHGRPQLGILCVAGSIPTNLREFGFYWRCTSTGTAHAHGCE
eukprot:IDg14257t1